MPDCPGQITSYFSGTGFPSPLLDWSESPSVATFFAFNRVAADVEQVAIYAYLERASSVKSSGSDRPTIQVVGPYVAGRRRHYLQQCQYTVCTASHMKTLSFAPHEQLFGAES